MHLASGLAQTWNVECPGLQANRTARGKHKLKADVEQRQVGDVCERPLSARKDPEEEERVKSGTSRAVLGSEIAMPQMKISSRAIT